MSYTVLLAYWAATQNRLGHDVFDAAVSLAHAIATEENQ